VDEMRGVQNHYRDLGRDPTDLELEMLAQTWSEHCVHKTLKSAVRYAGAPLPDPDPAKRQASGEVVVEYENLLRDTIARATNELIESGKTSWCLSVFKDNAGVIEFDRDYAVAFKVETHNHPSAIEPYGGSATGIGGDIRDVMGVGLGAKPIANTDVFCVGQPDFPMDTLPKGVLHPRRVLKGIVSGVRDYGNRMGIPTVNGAVVFDDRYLGNVLVFCGCVGLMPNWTIEKDPQPGDLVVVLGGRTGRDGIHGATFSSAELTDTHADEFSHAVQIGNAITEKQVLDAMLRMRKNSQPGSCLYTATTDCGAGGLSSAVGEMAEKLGADVELDNVPLKYAGLRYDDAGGGVHHDCRPPGPSREDSAPQPIRQLRCRGGTPGLHEDETGSHQPAVKRRPRFAGGGRSDHGMCSEAGQTLDKRHRFGVRHCGRQKGRDILSVLHD
jgi:phosphoribosylformylglycinamidine synthase